jgi:hypothetical protein
MCLPQPFSQASGGTGLVGLAGNWAHRQLVAQAGFFPGLRCWYFYPDIQPRALTAEWPFSSKQPSRLDPSARQCSLGGRGQQSMRYVSQRSLGTNQLRGGCPLACVATCGAVTCVQ